MGRPKKGEPPPGRLPTMVNVKCSWAWRTALDDAAKAVGKSSAEILAEAAERHLKRLGYALPDRLAVDKRPASATTTRPPARRRRAP